MRFHAGGPSIPDDLLVARDEGRVVFFCGAGVSRARAGLLDFFGLAEKVIDTLGVTTDDPVRKVISEARSLDARVGIPGLISADRVFGLLERDFPPREIETAVASALKPLSDVDLSAHQIMLDLAKTPDGKTRLITTNFDLLFELCSPSLPYHKPPHLPDPTRHDLFEGIIHLHGHVDNGYTGACGDGFVLSTSEFGHAYLADGWATQFIRLVLQKYIVVFIGYAADDPPVLYLLEALNRDQKSLSGMYAFQAGNQSDAEAKWRHKGVLPIAYDDTDHHKVLWESLSAWSSRARNTEKWYAEIIEMAQQGPESLLPHERGMVAHVVSTFDGAKRFAASTPPPPADWLCVFDPTIRFLKPGHLGAYSERGPFFDPFEAYGLENDPVPQKIDPEDDWAKREIPEGVWDCFKASRLDKDLSALTHFSTLRGHFSINLPSLSSRLWEIGIWISRVSPQPCSAWWASHQSGLHVEIQNRVISELERRGTEASPDVRRAWRCLFEAWGWRRKNVHDWFQIKRFIDLDGWSDATVREAVAIWRPHLKVTWPYSYGPKPPVASDCKAIYEMINVDVEYPEVHEQVDIPDPHLVTALREFRKNLETAILLEKDHDTYTYLTLPPIEPDPDLEGESSDRYYGISHIFLLYVGLLKRLMVLDPEGVKQECMAWWPEDDNIFARLRIWAGGRSELFSGSEAGRLFISLNDKVFWGAHHKRDLLLGLSNRWRDLPPSVRHRLEKRLLKGYSTSKLEDKDELKWRAWSSLNRLHWLHNNGCTFSLNLKAETEKLTKLAPEWKRRFASKAAASMEGRGGTVGSDTGYADLVVVPLDRVLTKSVEVGGRIPDTFTNRDPFAGLAANQPVRALSSLARAAKKGEWPEWAWRTFLNSPARENDKPNFMALVATRLSTAPVEDVATFIHPVSEWLLKCSSVLLNNFPEQFEGVWSNITKVLRSGVCNSTAVLSRGSKTRDWPTEALNAPVGKLAQAIMKSPEKEGLKRAKGFPCSWLAYVEELLGLPADHRRYALVMFAFNLPWFYYIDPAWTERSLLSVLENDGDDQDAFGGGFCWGAKQPDDKLFLRIKPWLTTLAKEGHEAGRREGNVVSAILLSAWGRKVVKKSATPLLPNAEFRAILLNADEQFRGHILWLLERWTADEISWVEKLPIFFNDVWPRQKQAKSPKISAKLCNFVFSNSKVFPVVVDIIVPLLTKIDREDFFISHLRQAKEGVLAEYPEQALSVLWAVLPDNSSQWPYGVYEALEKIGETLPILNDPRLIELNRRWNAR